MIIGTHALLYDESLFSDLGLVVIDEQHKFGVAQRAALIRRGVVPDVLVMTATPIPRTLTMTIYGDLDVSLLDEKPPGRGKIVTAVREGAKQTDVTKFVKEQLAAGRQAYLVYPLVEESENLKAESATEAFEKWRKRLPGHEVGLIHGKLKPDEKEEVMRRFREGEIAALVSTTVIEVGVDVPNATVMILHHAERFGLAQIHQLRGRIGRGGHKGYCILLTDGKNPEAMEKLKVLEQIVRRLRDRRGRSPPARSRRRARHPAKRPCRPPLHRFSRGHRAAARGPRHGGQGYRRRSRSNRRAPRVAPADPGRPPHPAQRLMRNGARTFSPPGIPLPVIMIWHARKPGQSQSLSRPRQKL